MLLQPFPTAAQDLLQPGLLPPHPGCRLYATEIYSRGGRRSSQVMRLSESEIDRLVASGWQFENTTLGYLTYSWLCPPRANSKTGAYVAFTAGGVSSGSTSVNKGTTGALLGGADEFDRAQFLAQLNGASGLAPLPPLNGDIYGFQLGYDRAIPLQGGNLIVGGVVELDKTNLSESFRTFAYVPSTVPPFGVTTNQTWQLSISNMWMLRGVAGWNPGGGPLTGYLTAGVVGAHESLSGGISSVSSPLGGPPFFSPYTTDYSRWGWGSVWGGGVNFSLAAVNLPNVSVGMEVLHFNLPSINAPAGAMLQTTGAGLPASVVGVSPSTGSMSGNIMRGRITHKFAWDDLLSYSAYYGSRGDRAWSR
jgi:hypothetical protein